MTGLRFIDHFLGPDTHSNRPAASAVPKGAKYVCTTHGIIYSSDQTAWTTWATLGGTYTDEQARDAIGAALVAGTGMTITVNDAGDTITLASASGSGGLAKSFVGKNAIGATGWRTPTTNALVKKVTVPSGGGILLSVAAHIRSAADTVADMSPVLFTDNSGTPDRLLVSSRSPGTTFIPNNGAGNIGASGTGRWVVMPLGADLAAGDYWVGFWTASPASLAIAYDAAGADRTMSNSNGWTADWGRYTHTTTSDDYSIRALLLA